MTQTLAPPAWTAALAPALVVLSPDPTGTPGRDHVDRIVAAVRRALPTVDVVAPARLGEATAAAPVPDGASDPALDPAVDEVLDRLRTPGILLPLTLTSRHRAGPVSAGTRVRQGAYLAEPLGPDRLLARALSVRLRQAGAQWGDAVVLAAGHLPGPAELEAATIEAGLLASEWGSPVSLACSSSLAPSVHEAVAELRAAGAPRVFVASYLLTPGLQSDAVARAAVEAGASGVADVLGAHRLLVELVVRRYRAALSSLNPAAAPAKSATTAAGQD